jgi:hypothetical protein
MPAITLAARLAITPLTPAEAITPLLMPPLAID